MLVFLILILGLVAPARRCVVAFPSSDRASSFNSTAGRRKSVFALTCSPSLGLLSFAHGPSLTVLLLVPVIRRYSPDRFSFPSAPTRSRTAVSPVQLQEETQNREYETRDAPYG